VLVIKLENVEMKREIMRNKYKGDRIFIENDVSWEERRIQERIVRWARDQKEKGVKIKIGRVRIENVWRKDKD